jgi:putative transposase
LTHAHCERFIGSIKRECLDHFIAFGEEQLRYLIAEYLEWYNTVRPHQCLGNKPLALFVREEGKPADSETPAREQPLSLKDVICDERLGGLLKHYRFAA